MFPDNSMFHLMKFMNQAYAPEYTPKVLSFCKGCVLACKHWYALVCSPNFIWFVLAFLVLVVVLRYHRGVLRDRASVALSQAALMTTEPRDIACGPDAVVHPPAKSATSYQATGLMQTNLQNLEAMVMVLKQDIVVFKITQMDFEKQLNKDHAQFVKKMKEAISNNRSALEIEGMKCYVTSLHQNTWVLKQQSAQRMQDTSNDQLEKMIRSR